MAGVVKELPEHRRSKLDQSKVQEAVAALLAYHKKIAQEQKKELLLNEANVIQLQLAVWKISGKKAKTIQIKLPNPISTSSTEACLFVKDLEGKSKEDCADHYNQLLQEKGITRVAEVIPLKTYRAEYKPFIARRQLANKYDIFLADERIFRLMHSHLGKEFYKRKKYPICVCLTKQDLKSEIEGTINASHFILSHRGDCNHFKVAHTNMTAEQVVENIMAGVQSMVERISKGWPNVKALYVKTNRSISLPIYTSLTFKDWAKDLVVDNTDLVRLKKQVSSEEPVTDAKEETKPDAKEEPATDAKEKPSSPKKTVVEVKKDAKASKPKEAKKRVLSEKPLANKKAPPSSTKEKKTKLTKRRLSGRALKKSRLKKEMEKTGVTDSRTLRKSSELMKKLEKASKPEVKKGKSKMAAKEVSKKVSKVQKEKLTTIKQPSKTVGSKRNSVEKPKSTKKGPTSAKKRKMPSTSS